MLRIALFGAGRIGRIHARSVDAHERAELAWVCDPVPQAARAVTDRHGGRATTDADQVFADRAVDAAVVASPTPTHVDLLTRAVRAGWPVLCEKPIDLDLTKVDRCWTEIAAFGPRVMTGFNRRFDPTFRHIRRRVADGDIGVLRSLRITSRDPEPPPADYLAGSGGIFRDMTVHDFDMARFFLGDVTEVHALASTDDRHEFAAAKDAHQAVVTLRAGTGALCTITNSRSCVFGYDQRLEVFGDGGMLEAANQAPTSVRAYGGAETEAAEPYLRFFLDRYREAYLEEFDAFVRVVQDGREPAPGFADGRAALALAEAAVESAATGRTMSVAPAPNRPLRSRPA